MANYFFFVANVATGLFSSLMRILKGLLFGVFYIGRLDQCVMMTGFENSDNGKIYMCIFSIFLPWIQADLTCYTNQWWAIRTENKPD